MELRSCTYNEKLRNILNEVSHGIVLINEKYIIKELNGPAVTMWGLKEEDLLGKKLTSLVSEDCIDECNAYLKKCRNQKPNTVDIQAFDFESKSNEFIRLEMDFNHFFRNSDDGQVYSIGLVYDVTDKAELEDEIKHHKKSKVSIQKKLEKELELSDMKSRFISIASHEFRTPLAGILSSIDLAERYLNAEQEKWNQFNNKPKVESHFNSIKNSINHLTATLNQFLSLGKLEEGEVTHNPKKLNLYEILERQIKEFEPLTKDGQVIHFKFKGEKKEVFMDGNMLRNIITNLISNAIKYTPEHKNIWINAETNTDGIDILVKDEGCGIPEAEQKNMFRRFFRAKNVVNIQGTGLGLTIVRRYMEMMNGTITFESEENIGTTFRLKFHH